MARCRSPKPVAQTAAIQTHYKAIPILWRALLSNRAARKQHLLHATTKKVIAVRYPKGPIQRTPPPSIAVAYSRATRSVHTSRVILHQLAKKCWQEIPQNSRPTRRRPGVSQRVPPSVDYVMRAIITLAPGPVVTPQCGVQLLCV